MMEFLVTVYFKNRISGEKSLIDVRVSVDPDRYYGVNSGFDLLDIIEKKAADAIGYLTDGNIIILNIVRLDTLLNK